VFRWHISCFLQWLSVENNLRVFTHEHSFAKLAFVSTHFLRTNPM
jgi:hypothetical protein